jgi:hypothetical protein
MVMNDRAAGQVTATRIGAEPKQKLVTWINTVV